MIFKLQEALVQLFISDKTSDVEDISAVNVAAMRLRELPYFEGAFPDHFLADRGNGFYQLHYRWRRDIESLDPLRDIYHSDYYEYYLEDDDEHAFTPPADYFPVRYPKTNTEDTQPIESALPEAIERKAQRYLDRLAEINPLMRLAQNPSPEDLQKRGEFQVKMMTHDELYDFSRALLGDTHQPSLKENGISYHNMGEHTWHRDIYRYAVVHNDHEIAGVAGLHHKNRSLSVSYVSTAHGYRKRGVSYLLYKELIEYAKAHDLIIERSSPGGDAADNPNITRAYDRLLREADVLHVGTNTYLTKALYSALDIAPYAKVLRIGKSTCDALADNARNEAISSYDREDVDRAATQSFKINMGLEAPALAEDTAESAAPAKTPSRRRSP